MKTTTNRVTKSAILAIIRAAAQESLAAAALAGTRTASGHAAQVNVGAWIALAGPLAGYELQTDATRPNVCQKWDSRLTAIRPIVRTEETTEQAIRFSGAELDSAAGAISKRLASGAPALPVGESFAQFRARLAALPVAS